MYFIRALCFYFGLFAQNYIAVVVSIIVPAGIRSVNRSMGPCADKVKIPFGNFWLKKESFMSFLRKSFATYRTGCSIFMIFIFKRGQVRF